MEEESRRRSGTGQAHSLLVLIRELHFLPKLLLVFERADGGRAARKCRLKFIAVAFPLQGGAELQQRVQVGREQVIQGSLFCIGKMSSMLASHFYHVLPTSLDIFVFFV